MDHEDRFQELEEGLTATFLMLTKLLAQLPIPIDLPPLGFVSGGAPSPANILRAIDRARTVLVQDQPITADQREWLELALLDWMIAYDLGEFFQMLGSEHRLDGMDSALDRVMIFADQAAKALGINLD